MEILKNLKPLTCSAVINSHILENVIFTSDNITSGVNEYLLITCAKINIIPPLLWFQILHGLACIFLNTFKTL